MQSNSKLYVGNLSYSTGEGDCRRSSRKPNPSSRFPNHRPRYRTLKGFAFIEMTTQAEAEKAISMFNGKELGDRTLTVNVARPREERGGEYGAKPYRPGGRPRGRKYKAQGSCSSKQRGPPLETKPTRRAGSVSFAVGNASYLA
jgi:RNA recognition motif-containing protein